MAIFKAIKESVMSNNAYGNRASASARFEMSSRNEVRPEPQPMPPQAAVPKPAPAVAPEPSETWSAESPATGHVLSVIGPSLVFKGKLTAEEDLLIQGHVEGSIRHNGANLTIGAHGEVEADIVGKKVIIQGTVRGDVRASDAVIVEASARVQGNLFAPRIALREGAKFKGSIDMDVDADAATRNTRGQDAAKARTDRSARSSDDTLPGGKVDELLDSTGS